MVDRKLETVEIRNLSADAAEKIRQAITSGRLKAGTRLIELDLAEELGLSRSPIREALYLLEREGLIVRRPHRGAFVRGLSEQETEEIFSTRSVIETFLLRRAMSRMTEGDLARLEGFVDRMRQAASEKNVEAFSEADAEFHLFLCDMASHSLLKKFLSSLNTRIVQYMVEASNSRALPLLVEDHVSLLEVIRDGDADKATELLQLHIQSSAERLISDPLASLERSITPEN